MILRVLMLFLCSFFVVYADETTKQNVADFVKRERDAGRIPVLKKAHVGVFFQGDLTGLDLRYVDFRGLTYSGTNLSNTKLKGAKFTGVDLGGIIFDGADLRGVIGFGTPTYGRVSLVGADLSGADLSDKDFENYDFTGVKMKGSNVCGSRFHGSDFLLSQFEDAVVKNTIILNHPSEGFRKAMSYRGAVTERSLLEHRLRWGVPYRHVSFHSFDFTGANLEKVDFTGYMLNYARFDKANLKGAIFDDADVIGAKWIGAQLKGARFLRANCEGGDFSDAELEGVDFTDTAIRNTNFVKARGVPKQEIEFLRDESDYEWNQFWRSVVNVFDKTFPFLYFIAFLTAISMSAMVLIKKEKVYWLGFVIYLSFGVQLLSVLLMFGNYDGMLAAMFICMVSLGIILLTSLGVLIKSSLERSKLNWFNVFCVVSHCVILYGIPYFVISVFASV